MEFQDLASRTYFRGGYSCSPRPSRGRYSSIGAAPLNHRSLPMPKCLMWACNLSIAPYSPGRQRGASATWRTEKVLTTRRAGQTMRHAKNGPISTGLRSAHVHVPSTRDQHDAQNALFARFRHVI
jgi:hypothetical protein